MLVFALSLLTASLLLVVAGVLNRDEAPANACEGWDEANGHNDAAYAEMLAGIDAAAARQGKCCGCCGMAHPVALETHGARGETVQVAPPTRG